MARRIRSGRRPWTDAETKRLLKARGQGKTLAECAALLGRTHSMVQNKLRRLGATRSNSMRGKRAFEIRWSARDERTVKCTYGHCRAEQLATRLCRTRCAIYSRAFHLRVTAARAEYWSHADLVAVLTWRVPPCQLRLASPRTHPAIQGMKSRLRQLWKSGQLNAFLASRSETFKAKPLRFGRGMPPGLTIDWARLSSRAKDKRAREYLARATEHERQKAALEKWRAQRSR